MPLFLIVGTWKCDWGLGLRKGLFKGEIENWIGLLNSIDVVQLRVGDDKCAVISGFRGQLLH